jgi:HlyD family secretion protein
MKDTATLTPVDLAAVIQSGATHHGKRNLILVILILAAVAGMWLWRRSAAQAKSDLPAYVTEALTRGDISLVITATGNLYPTNEVTVGSELSGITLEVYVDFNDHVIKGQPLAKLDTSRLMEQTESSRASVRASQARVVLAQATVKESQALLARQQDLHKISNGAMPSDADLDVSVAAAARASADLLSTQASVGEAEAQVHINENDLSKAIIKSPIDGVVLTRSIEPGQTVAASFTAPQLFIIAEKLERMKLEVAIAEADIGRVAKGQSATFTVDAWPDRTYKAQVSIVASGSEVKDNVVTYEADLEVNNDDLSLRPGMTATADIRVAESTQVFLVPTVALRFDPSAATAATGPAKKSFVQSLIPMPTRNRSRPETQDMKKAGRQSAQLWVLRNDRAEPITIKLGLTDGRHTEISGEGLSEDLLVITRASPPTP